MRRALATSATSRQSPVSALQSMRPIVGERGSSRCLKSDAGRQASETTHWQRPSAKNTGSWQTVWWQNSAPSSARVPQAVPQTVAMLPADDSGRPPASADRAAWAARLPPTGAPEWRSSRRRTSPDAPPAPALVPVRTTAGSAPLSPENAGHWTVATSDTATG